MKPRNAWRRFWSPHLALAFDRDTLWRVAESEDAPRVSPTSLALDRTSRRIVAARETALAEPDSSKWEKTEYIRHGGIGLLNAAVAGFRSEFGGHFKGRLRLAPRVLVACPNDETAKRAIKNAVIRAGARDVITMPKTMAAAIGSGLDVTRNTVASFIYLIWTATGSAWRSSPDPGYSPTGKDTLARMKCCESQSLALARPATFTPPRSASSPARRTKT